MNHKKKNRAYLCFDFETNDTLLNNCVPVEFAALMVDINTLEEVGSFRRLMRLEEGETMSARAQELHGYTIQYLADNGIRRIEALVQFGEWLEVMGFPIPSRNEDPDFSGTLYPMGQNILQFDLPILKTWMGYPAASIFSYSAVDTMLEANFINRAARHAFGWGAAPFVDPVSGYPSASLAAQCHALGIDLSGHHGALADARATLQCARAHLHHLAEDLHHAGVRVERLRELGLPITETSFSTIPF